MNLVDHSPTSAVFAVKPPLGAVPPQLSLLLVGMELEDPLLPFGKLLCVSAGSPFVTITPSVCSIVSTLGKMWRYLPACYAASHQPLAIAPVACFDAAVGSALHIKLIAVASVEITRVCQVGRLRSDIS